MEYHFPRNMDSVLVPTLLLQGVVEPQTKSKASDVKLAFGFPSVAVSRIREYRNSVSKLRDFSFNSLLIELAEPIVDETMTRAKQILSSVSWSLSCY